MPLGERQAIFKPFARLDDSRTRSSGGYGLGLSIVQKVMNWHGGSVSVDDSAELGGARFTLLLPQRNELGEPQAGLMPSRTAKEVSRAVRRKSSIHGALRVSSRIAANSVLHTPFSPSATAFT